MNHDMYKSQPFQNNKILRLFLIIKQVKILSTLNFYHRSYLTLTTSVLHVLSTCHTEYFDLNDIMFTITTTSDIE